MLRGRFGSFRCPGAIQVLILLMAWMVHGPNTRYMTGHAKPESQLALPLRMTSDWQRCYKTMVCSARWEFCNTPKEVVCTYGP